MRIPALDSRQTTSVKLVRLCDTRLIKINMTTSKRNRASTMKRISAALEEIINQEGLQGVNVNAVAKKANISKTLVYHYFDDINGLFEYGLQQGDLLPHFKPVDLELLQPTSSKDVSYLWIRLSLEFVRHLRASRTSREMIKATFQKEGMGKTIYNAVNTELTTLNDQLASARSDDQQATSAILVGGLLYLTVQAHLDRPVLGIDLRTEAGWQRIERAAWILHQALYKSTLD